MGEWKYKGESCWQATERFVNLMFCVEAVCQSGGIIASWVNKGSESVRDCQGSSKGVESDRYLQKGKSAVIHSVFFPPGGIDTFYSIIVTNHSVLHFLPLLHPVGPFFWILQKMVLLLEMLSFILMLSKICRLHRLRKTSSFHQSAETVSNVKFLLLEPIVVTKPSVRKLKPHCYPKSRHA